MTHDLWIYQTECYPAVLHSVSKPAVKHKQLNPGKKKDKNNILRGKFM
jgi:hypothetical protein